MFVLDSCYGVFAASCFWASCYSCYSLINVVRCLYWSKRSCSSGCSVLVKGGSVLVVKNTLHRGRRSLCGRIKSFEYIAISYHFFSVFSSRSWPNIIIVPLATPCSLSLSQLAPCLAIGAARYPSPRWMRRLSLHKAMIATLRHVECFCHSRQCTLRGWRCLGRTLWAAHRTCKGTWSSKLHIENMSEMIDSRKLQFASFRRSGGAMKYLYAAIHAVFLQLYHIDIIWDVICIYIYRINKRRMRRCAWNVTFASCEESKSNCPSSIATIHQRHHQGAAESFQATFRLEKQTKTTQIDSYSVFYLYISKY